ncbi:hypothetical protein SAMN05216311_111108 [Chitinophaga sp. CF418]|nr:hypothetical protein SAMN05216311_111108 [Chitinophaga sp. CF418]
MFVTAIPLPTDFAGNASNALPHFPGGHFDSRGCTPGYKHGAPAEPIAANDPFMQYALNTMYTGRIPDTEVDMNVLYSRSGGTHSGSGVTSVPDPGAYSESRVAPRATNTSFLLSSMSRKKYVAS